METAQLDRVGMSLSLGTFFLFQLVDPKEHFGTYENLLWGGCTVSLSGTPPNNFSASFL